MFTLPKSAQVNSPIPTQKLYDRLNMTPELEKAFTEQVDSIYWRYKIATTTTNLAPGNNVTELQIFEVTLKTPTLNKALLKHIDQYMPYHILFILTYQGQCQAWIGYKEATISHAFFKVNRYYHSEWLPKEQLQLKLDGLSVDAVYDSFIFQIAGERLSDSHHSDSLKTAITQDEKRQKLQKQITALQNKIAKEKQLNKQIQLNTELKKLKQDLETL